MMRSVLGGARFTYTHNLTGKGVQMKDFFIVEESCKYFYYRLKEDEELKPLY